MATNQSTLQDQYAELRALINKGESSDYQRHGLSSAYDAWYGYMKGLQPANGTISNMPLSNLFEYQRNMIDATRGTIKGQPADHGTSAVGKYQFTLSTLLPLFQKYKDEYGLDENTKFTPEVQDLFANLLIEESGGKAWREKALSDDDFINSLAGQWASFAGANGKTAYKGQDRVGVTVDEMRQALTNIRNGVIPEHVKPNVVQVTPKPGQEPAAPAQPAATPAPQATVSPDMEEIIKTKGLIRSGDKWYHPTDGPSSIYDKGFSKGSATFNFDKAIASLGDSDKDRMIKDKLLKIKEEMGDQAKIDLDVNGDTVSWKWRDQSHRDKRWSGVAADDKHGPFGGKKALGLSGAHFEQALEFMLSGDYLNYDKSGPVADLTKEWTPEKHVEDTKPADVKPEVPKTEDTKVPAEETKTETKPAEEEPKVKAVKVGEAEATVLEDADPAVAAKILPMEDAPKKEDEVTRSKGKGTREYAEKISKNLKLPANGGFLAWEEAQKNKKPAELPELDEKAKLALLLKGTNVDGKSGKFSQGGILVARRIVFAQQGTKVFKQEVDPTNLVKAPNGLDKLLTGIDLNAIAKFAFSKPVRSKPVHLNVASYKPTVIRNPETGILTENNRIAEQELANNMQTGVSSNPDDVRTSIAKAKSMAQYRASMDQSKAQNTLATKQNFTQATNQEIQREAAYEDAVNKTDYMNKASDAQSDMQADVLEQKRRGDLAAGMIAGFARVGNADRAMKFQEAQAKYNSSMKQISNDNVIALNKLQEAQRALSWEKPDSPNYPALKAAADKAKEEYDRVVKDTKVREDEITAQMLADQKGLAYKQANPTSMASVSYKDGGSLEKEQIKAEVKREQMQIKKALDDKKQADKNALTAYKIYKEATEVVKKSNLVLAKIYFKR